MTHPPADIALGLVSHTNAGKTTLARTLLGRDVGEVRDAPHVTDLAEAYTLIETPEGDALRLWDTPGFGDSARLARRLRAADNPIGWILREVWDRYANRPLWCSQQAVRAARESADVVLYVVNAAEDPRDAGYLGPEMQILTWIGKPVLLLLNQMGPPRPAADERAEEERWRACVTPFPTVRGVLTLDAFARCWVQEDALFGRVADLVAPDKRAAFDRLVAAWHARSVERFESAMGELAGQIMAAVRDREAIVSAAPPGNARRLLRALGFGSDPADGVREEAMAQLAERADEHIRAVTDRLIALHGLEGSAAATVLERLQENYATTEPLSEGQAAAVGGVVTGALAGLAADLAAGGLTLGTGLIVGTLAGALGGAGLARGRNWITGAESSSVAWSPAFLDGLVRSALLRYLVVAHYGRGRGAYAESEAPAFWKDELARAFEDRRPSFEALWDNARGSADAAQAEADLRAMLADTAGELLDRLYPERVAACARPAPPGAVRRLSPPPGIA
ncbi:MAG: DUF3482 domain-containing protein [Gammaproteobacteria bacterium]|nr:MAG: DUF3482 domain-containing protein [Gammaproteobacteria bacterium]